MASESTVELTRLEYFERASFLRPPGINLIIPSAWPSMNAPKYKPSPQSRNWTLLIDAISKKDGS